MRAWPGRARDRLRPSTLRTPAWDLLDVLRRPPVLRRIPAEEIAVWARRILRLVEASHFTVGPLLPARASAYGSRPLFQYPNRSGVRSLELASDVAARVELLARALLALDPDGRTRPDRDPLGEPHRDGAGSTWPA